MKKRTIAYFKKLQALKVIANPLSFDLTTFLAASKEMSRSRIVKQHIESSLQELSQTFVPKYGQTKKYKLSA